MPEKVKVKREVTDISPKTNNPSIVLLVITAVQLVASGGWNAPESLTAIAAVVSWVVSYFSTDKVNADAKVVDAEDDVIAEVGV